MESAGLPVVSCVFAPSLDTPAHIELAERLGYRRAWCYDSPAMYADPWMILALAAARTRQIGLGPASLVPSLRHPMVTAAALATLAGLAPGRVSAAFGTGLTGRLLLGERPLRWAEVARYVQAVRALVRGEEANWNGSLLRMSQPAGFTAARSADIAVLIAADGPKGAAVAADLGDGMLSTRVPGTPAGAGGTAPGGARRQVLLTFGTVLDDGEDAVGSRVTAAAGPALAAACHAICDWPSAAPYGLRRATQALTLAGAYRRGEPACDAIDELAFDDEASAARCLADAAFRRAWASDLLDPASVACLTVEEHVVKSEPVPASFVKNYEFVMKRPDMARDEFDRYWAQVHGPLAATIPTIRRYVQAHLSPGTRDAGTAPLDGLAITWFDDVAAMRAGAVTEAYARTRADERNFLAGELPFVVTTERPTFPCPDLGVAE